MMILVDKYYTVHASGLQGQERHHGMAGTCLRTCLETSVRSMVIQAGTSSIYYSGSSSSSSSSSGGSGSSSNIVPWRSV